MQLPNDLAVSFEQGTGLPLARSVFACNMRSDSRVPERRVTRPNYCRQQQRSKQIDAFENKVNAYVKSGQITSDEGKQLISAAEELKKSLIV